MSNLLIEHVYGLLWKDAGGSEFSHAARKLLLAELDKEGQRRGIQYALDNTPKPWLKTIQISAAHLKRIGDDAIVSLEIDGLWVDVISEQVDGSFSHIVEHGGILDRLLTTVAEAT